MVELRDGTIMSVIVKNFICHKYLEMNFEKSIKFIVGLNGSGKSSILDALILGLGGRAADTQRFDTIKKFILYGAEFASIQIRLKNSGPNAYKPAEYGPYITVIREIYASGSSNYIVKSATDEVKGRRYASLEAILLAHNIQINNPMSVLPQKLSKQFMDRTKHSEKYAFFSRATNLTQSEEYYEEALKNCDDAKKIWENQKKICDDLEGKMRQWEQIMESFTSQEKNKVEKRNLEQELKWSDVVEKERLLEIEKRKCQGLQNELEQHQNVFSRITSSLGSDKIREIKSRKLEESNKRESLKNEKESLENMKSELEIDLTQIRNSRSHIVQTMERQETKILDFKKQIQDIKSGSAETRRTALAAEADQARRDAQAAGARLHTADDHLRQTDAALERARQADADAQQVLREHSEQLAKTEHSVASLQRARDSLAAYGSCAARLAQRVRDAAAAGHFRHAPRGPVGAYLSVEDETWSSVLEHILGAAIKSYCVDNGEDAGKLFALIREVYSNSREPTPSVSCSEFLPRAHDTRPREARAPAALCALRALRVADPVVHNYLVDQLELEAVLLVRDDDCAMRLCRAPDAPLRAKRVYTADCAEYRPAPRYRCYGGEAAPVRYLYKDQEHAVRELRRRAQELAARAEGARAGARRAAEARRGAEGAREAAQAARRALHADLQRREAAARRAEDALAQQREPQLTQLEEELVFCEEKLTSEREKLSELEQRERNKSAEIEKIKQDIANVATRLRAVNVNIENAEREIEQLESEINNSQSRADHLKKKIDTNKAHVDKMKTEIQEREREIERLVSKAASGGPRMENPRDKRVLGELLQQKEAELGSYARAPASPAEARAQLQRARGRHATVAGHLRDLDRIIREMTDMVRRHQKTCLVRQKAVILYVHNRLTKIMHMRKMRNTLHIDPVARTLKVDDSRCSSGGESTYTMIALILALQDCVDLPFFCMDEFDVYLDGVNQEMVVELLLQAARKRPSCQYVFITPNAPDGLCEADDLDIYTFDPIPT